ncbi:MAG: hypothetical protein SWO11_15380 [Thermodesulfobacteriota bacterium]|nr:hypothetical protein [Thermodesulfobacteriota bacterium]
MRCSDCDAQLVYELPTKPPEPGTGYIDFIKRGAENAQYDRHRPFKVYIRYGITYFFQGEHFLYMRHMALPARLMIKVDQEKRPRRFSKILILHSQGSP